MNCCPLQVAGGPSKRTADRPHTQHGERQNNTTNDTKGISAEENRQIEANEIYNIHGCGNVYLHSCNSHDLQMQNCGNHVPTLSEINS